MTYVNSLKYTKIHLQHIELDTLKRSINRKLIKNSRLQQKKSENLTGKILNRELNKKKKENRICVDFFENFIKPYKFIKLYN